ncbi:hypothetical protein GTR02_07830 [Kineococcus sp. R8]|uniref:hypothetical protein n=1 Tax=Kineococcus siccus TaxID=2696567 RepID=UPI00141213C9|nr:hypothetical protein [Kineococcus siccus]NAZ81727.1 hypothetical protein [Kineococcus siccus]
MSVLAGRADLTEVVERLRAERSLFHSEADLQHAFAMMVARADPSLRIRLEVPFRDERSTYLDLLVSDAATGLSTAVELKYFTQRLQVDDPLTGEHFDLRSHAADDLVRLGVVRDVHRLEQWSGPRRNGISLLLSNARTLWATSADRPTRDRAFRIHQGRQISGQLVWGDGDHEPNDVTLQGTYTADWQLYSDLPVPHGEFRWLAFEVGAAA